MTTASRDRLARTLRGDAKTAFSVELTARTDDLRLEVEGFGPVKFPVRPAGARKLLSLGQPARFGRGEDTLTDPDVRDTWEIPKHLVRAGWNNGMLNVILATVKEELGLPNAAELTADLHSLLVYEPNQFFLAHQDTEKDDSMIGTLVVTLPSNYAGGELMVGHNEGAEGLPGVCASPETGDLTPYSSEYEGYMGNWGNTLDRWYRRAAVVVWPREQAFANRAVHKKTPGNCGAWVMSRIDGDSAEILALSFWDARDAIEAFAGPDIEQSVLYPEDERYLLAAPTVRVRRPQRLAEQPGDPALLLRRPCAHSAVPERRERRRGGPGARRVTR
jgi:hypothetical protein